VSRLSSREKAKQNFEELFSNCGEKKATATLNNNL
jgi:hypothetical protein